MNIFKVVAALVCFIPSTAWCDDALNIGNALASRGDIKGALAQWSGSSSPEAPYNIGMAALDGNVPDCDRNCSLEWFKKSAAGDFIPALTPIAMLFINDGQREKGVSILNHGARWNDHSARDLLIQMQEPLPAPDLYMAHVEQQRLEQERNDAQAQHQQQQIQNEIRRLEQQQAAAAYAPALGNIMSCIIAKTACGQSEQPSYALPRAYAPAPITSYQPSNDSSVARQRTILCPNGQYVVGDRCHMAPDGSFQGTKPQMAPDGSFVGGRPQMAPDGSYVGGQGRLRLCPDGSYVVGSRCKMMPDGTYVGAN